MIESGLYPGLYVNLEVPNTQTGLRMNRVPFFYREFGTLVNAENADFFSLISVNQRCLRPDTLI